MVEEEEEEDPETLSDQMDEGEERIVEGDIALQLIPILPDPNVSNYYPTTFRVWIRRGRILWSGTGFSLNTQNKNLF